MNLEPNIWGPQYWGTLHFMASTYDNNPNLSIQSTMKNFIQSLPVFLPCKECQDHAFELVKKTDLNKVVQNRKELFTFFFDFHNSVNQRLKKPLMKIEDALVKYYIPKEEYHLYRPSKGRNGPIFGSVDFGSKNMETSSYWLRFVVVIIVVLTIIFLVKK